MKHRWLLIGFTSLALTGLGFSTATAEEKEEKEEKVSMKDVPKEVRATLKREANGEKITTVDKEELKGKTVYEADVKMDGHNYEIVVDEKGLLLSKKLDDEDDEKASEEKDKPKAKHEEKSARESEEGHKDKKASKNEAEDDEKSDHKKSEKGKKDKDDEDEKK